VAAEEALEKLAVESIPWLEDGDRAEALASLYRRVGRDPETARGDVEVVTMDDFRREIGAPSVVRAKERK